MAGAARLSKTGGLTPELVRTVAFNKPPIGQRGDDEDEVDAFLDLVEAAPRDPTGRSLSAEQVGSKSSYRRALSKPGFGPLRGGGAAYDAIAVNTHYNPGKQMGAP
jgi:DivIVA domain-containing protein